MFVQRRYHRHQNLNNSSNIELDDSFMRGKEKKIPHYSTSLQFKRKISLNSMNEKNKDPNI